MGFPAPSPDGSTRARASSATRAWLPTAWVCVLSGICVYVAVLGWATSTKYAHFLYTDFDLAVHAQSLHAILAGSLQSSILGVPFLGNHFVPVLYLLAPAVAWFDPARVLLWVQTVGLALGAVPLYLLARRQLPARTAAALTIAYLAYPPLITLNLYEFHPVALVVALMLGMFYAFDAQRFAGFLALGLLSLLCQENIAFILAGFGLYALLCGRRGRWVWAPVALGGAWFVMVVLIIMPQFNTDTIQFYEHLYGRFGQTPGEIAGAVLSRPVDAARVASEPAKRAFIASLLAPLGGLSLLSPVCFVPDVLVLAQRLLSARAAEASIAYHYQAEFIACVFAGAVFGCRRLLAWRASFGRLLVTAVLAVMPALCFSISGVPGALAALARAAATPSVDTRERDAMLGAVKPDDAVLATFRFLPRLADRSGLYSFHHAYTGLHTLSDVPYAIDESLDVVLLDTRDPLAFGDFYGREHYRNIRELLRDSAWRVVRQREHLLLMRRGGEGPHPFTLTAYAGDARVMRRRVRMDSPDTFADAATLEGFRVDALGSDTVRVTLYWVGAGDASADFCIRVRLLDDAGAELAARVLVPGHRLMPPHAWERGRTVAERHVLVDSDPDGIVARTASLHATRLPLASGLAALD